MPKITLKAARINAGMTQANVAKKMNVHANTLASWEKGVTEPSWGEFVFLCDLYGFDTEDIFLPQKTPKRCEEVKDATG